jgi:hypothetical protein
MANGYPTRSAPSAGTAGGGGQQCGTFDVAMAAIARAIGARRHASDVLGLGNALRISAPELATKYGGSRGQSQEALDDV